MIHAIWPVIVPTVEHDVKRLFCSYIALQVVTSGIAMLLNLDYYKLQ